MSWKAICLNEFIADKTIDIQTGPFGTQLKASDYVDFGIPVINVRNIGYGKLKTDKLEYISENTLSKLHKHTIQTNDIIFGRKGAVDRHLLVQQEQEGWLQGSDCIRLRILRKSISPKFLSYCLLGESHKKWILTQCSNKSTMASLNQDVISRIVIRLPDECTQERIVSTISAYDDLIENNRRRIQLLEESARQLYKEWFVRLRFPGHEHVKVVDGVPEGWERKTLGEVATTNSTSYSSKNLPEKIRYIDISTVSIGRINERKEFTNTDAPGRARRIAKHGDIIWSNVRPNLKAYALVFSPENNEVFSTGFTIITPSHVPYTFLYMVTTTDEFVSYLVNQATGSSYPAVRATDFERKVLLVPSGNVLKEYHRSTVVLFEQKHALEQQNRKLAQARDLLLPKLMSGEVAV